MLVTLRPFSSLPVPSQANPCGLHLPECFILAPGWFDQWEALEEDEGERLESSFLSFFPGSNPNFPSWLCLYWVLGV